MPHSGEALGVDLADLYDAGRYKLTLLADQFGEAKQMLHHTTASAAIFMRHPQFGGSVGPAKEVWEELRDQLVGLLLTTEENLLATGAALMMAAEEYGSTDAEAMMRYRELHDRLDRTHQDS